MRSGSPLRRDGRRAQRPDTPTTPRDRRVRADCPVDRDDLGTDRGRRRAARRAPGRRLSPLRAVELVGRDVPPGAGALRGLQPVRRHPDLGRARRHRQARPGDVRAARRPQPAPPRDDGLHRRHAPQHRRPRRPTGTARVDFTDTAELCDGPDLAGRRRRRGPTRSRPARVPGHVLEPGRSVRIGGRRGPRARGPRGAQRGRGPRASSPTPSSRSG